MFNQFVGILFGALLWFQIGAIRPPALVDATRIVVVDDWQGYALSIQSHYEINLTDSVWVGDNEYSVTGEMIGQTGTYTARPKITIPKPVVDTILRSLSDIKLSQREYKPKFEGFDDYPYKRIMIFLPSDSVEFLTYSQGKHNTPWKVIFADSSYTTGSHAPAQALKKLQPFLQKEVLDSLKLEAEKRTR